MYFILRFNVVSPPCLHNHGLELFQFCELRGQWKLHSSELLRVDMLRVKEVGWWAPKFWFGGHRCQISMKVEVGIALCLCLCLGVYCI